MHPTLIVLGLRLSTYNVAYGLGMVLAGSLAYARSAALLDAWPMRTLTRRLAIVMACAFAGTYAISLFPTAIQSLRAGRWVGHIQAAYPGTLTAAALAVAVLYRREPELIGRALDVGAPSWPLLLAIGRVGCWSAGCCGGVATDSPLACYLRDTNGMWAWRYPTQVMSGLNQLLAFALLLAYERLANKRASRGGWPFPGSAFLLYAAYFSVERFTLEFLRADRAPLVGPLSWMHLYCAVGLTICAIFLVRGLRRQKACGPQPPSPGAEGAAAT